MSALTAGDILEGKWRIVRPAIGDEPGSEFRVEPVEGTGAGRLTLWRTLRPPTPAELARFEALLRTGERTGNAAFLPVRDVGYDPAREALWLVRPWWNGESLPSMLGGLHEVGLELSYLCALAEQLARALTEAQAAGVVHGRLRPSRLLVSPDGTQGVRLAILDLGLEVFRRTHAQAWLKAPQVGTAYVAPELGDPGPVPPSADVFSFGLVVRDMLASRKDGAWQGRWESWVARATAPAPAKRFSSLTEAMDALRPVLRALPNPPPQLPANYEPIKLPGQPSPPPPEPPPPAPPPSMRTAAFEDFVALFTAALPSATKQEPRKGVVHLRSEKGELVLDRDESEGVLGGIRWRLPTARTWSAAEKFVEDVLAVERLRSGGPPATPDPTWKAELTEHAELEPRREEDPEKRRRGSGLEADDQGITALYAHESWVTSHDLERVRTPHAWIPWTSLPADLERATHLLMRVRRVAYLMNAYPSYVCRFCRKTFEAIHFHSDLEACHPCSERHLGVRH